MPLLEDNTNRKLCEAVHTNMVAFMSLDSHVFIARRYKLRGFIF